MEILHKILEVISGDVLAQSSIIAVVLEFIFRLIPSKKPVSIAWLIRDGIEIVAKILGSVAELLDKILPQRLK